MYGWECWAMDKKIEQSMSDENIKMEEWCEKKKQNKKLNILEPLLYYSFSIKVSPIIDKRRENILRWLGYVLRKEEPVSLRVINIIFFEGKRNRERP